MPRFCLAKKRRQTWLVFIIHCRTHSREASDKSIAHKYNVERGVRRWYCLAIEIAFVCRCSARMVNVDFGSTKTAQHGNDQTDLRLSLSLSPSSFGFDRHRITGLIVPVYWLTANNETLRPTENVCNRNQHMLSTHSNINLRETRIIPISMKDFLKFKLWMWNMEFNTGCSARWTIQRWWALFIIRLSQVI